MSVDDSILMQGGKKDRVKDPFPTEHGESRAQLFVLARLQVCSFGIEMFVFRAPVIVA